MADLPPSVTVSPGVSVNLVQYLRPGVSLPSARLLVLLHHGIGEHAGRYEDFASALLAAAPSLDGVLSYNCRGHGTSAPRRRDVCAVAGVAQLVDDFSAVLTHWAALAPDARFVLAGHSLGGLVIAGVAAAEDCPANGAERARIGGVVLSAPALKVHVVGLVNKVIAPVAGLVASIPGARCITKKVSAVAGGRFVYFLRACVGRSARIVWRDRGAGVVLTFFLLWVLFCFMSISAVCVLFRMAFLSRRLRVTCRSSRSMSMIL